MITPNAQHIVLAQQLTAPLYRSSSIDHIASASDRIDGQVARGT
jgi:hypothetical protein